MTDWTTCRVVRDRDGRLWMRYSTRSWESEDPGEPDTNTSGLGSNYGPLTPVLDADGLPVVTTVGDITARHQLARPRIRVAGREGKLKFVKPSDAYPGTVTLIWSNCWENAALEEPCEVLP